MLTANNTDGQLIIAPEGEEQTLRALGKSRKLVCPACEGYVFYRSATFIPHFVHFKSECSIAYSEPESKEHLEAKWALFKSLSDQGLRPILERYFPETRQRADVSLEVNSRTIAIEVQLSHISNRVWLQRRDLYRSIGVEDFWYFGCHPDGSKRMDHPSQVYRLGGFPNNGDWDEFDADRNANRKSLQINATAQIKGRGFQVTIRRHRRGPLPPMEEIFQEDLERVQISVPFEKCVFWRGCPDIAGLRLVRLTADKLQNFDLSMRKLLDISGGRLPEGPAWERTKGAYHRGNIESPYWSKFSSVDYRGNCSTNVGLCHGWPHTNCEPIEHQINFGVPSQSSEESRSAGQQMTVCSES